MQSQYNILTPVAVLSRTLHAFAGGADQSLFDMNPQKKGSTATIPGLVPGSLSGQEDRASGSNWKNQFVSFFQPSDNKLALKLFGTKSALLKERKRQQESGHWIIHPASSFRSDPRMHKFLELSSRIWP